MKVAATLCFALLFLVNVEGADIVLDINMEDYNAADLSDVAVDRYRSVYSIQIQVF